MALTPEQEAIHATGLGASEISGTCGRNPWASPFDIWAKKPTANRPAVPEDEPDAVERSRLEVGSVLEASLIELYRRRHPDVAVRHLSHVTQRHPEHAWVIASPDGEVGPADDLEALLELKVVGFHMADWWEQGPPDFVRLQAQWQMFVFRHRFRTHRPRVHILRLLGTDYEEYETEYDEALVEACFDIARTFWFDYVQQDRVPPVGALENRSEYLQKRFPRPKLNIQTVPPDYEDQVQAMVDRLVRAKASYGKIKAELDTAEDDLKELIGEAEGIRGKWGVALWKWYHGQTSYKSLAASLCDFGVIPEELKDRFRGRPFRKFDLKLEGK